MHARDVRPWQYTMLQSRRGDCTHLSVAEGIREELAREWLREGHGCSSAADMWSKQVVARRKGGCVWSPTERHEP